MSRNISVSFNAETLKKIEDYARENGISKSGFIAMCVNQHIASMEMFKQLPGVLDKLHEISSKVDDIKSEK